MNEYVRTNKYEKVKYVHEPPSLPTHEKDVS